MSASIRIADHSEGENGTSLLLGATAESAAATRMALDEKYRKQVLKQALISSNASTKQYTEK